MQQQCLLIDSKIVIIPIIILLGFLTIVTITFLFKTYRLRVWNPIQELSPSLTIAQGFSLYAFIALSLIVLIVDSKDEFNAIRYLMIFQNYFRGLFIVVTIFKSLRITLAFSLNPDSRNSLVEGLCFKLFRSEKRLALTSLLLTALLWTGLFYIVQLAKNDDIYQNRDQMSDIIQYETVNTVEAINNVVEVVLCLLIIYGNEKIKIPQFDALKEYISKPLFIYAIWLYLNTFLNYLIKEDGCIEESGGDLINRNLPMPFVFMWLSQILRCLVEFYFIVYKPIKNSTYIRLPLIPSAVLNDFQLFMRIPLCSTVFYKYVQLDSQQYGTKSFNQVERRVNYSMSQEFQEFSNNLKVLEAWMVYQMKLENGQEDSHFTEFMDLEKRKRETQFFLNSQGQILIRLEKHIDCVFRDYKQTKSFQYMNSLFGYLDNATRNFYELNIIQNFLN